MKRALITLLSTLALGGCMSFSSTAKTGESCTFSGYGLIGWAIAKSNYDECMERIQK